MCQNCGIILKIRTLLTVELDVLCGEVERGYEVKNARVSLTGEERKPSLEKLAEVTLLMSNQTS